LANGLKESKSLIKIDLSGIFSPHFSPKFTGNEISTSGATAIADALKENKTLQDIELSGKDRLFFYQHLQITQLEIQGQLLLPTP
jgi:hypothetical protein